MCSGDPTFPVRVEQVAGADATPALPNDAEIVESPRGQAVPAGPRTAVARMMEAYQRAHGREPFTP
jgi:hypothetical protein